MSEPNPSDLKLRTNETFGEMYARFEKEAWASGGFVTGGTVMIICSVRLLAALAVRLVNFRGPTLLGCQVSNVSEVKANIWEIPCKCGRRFRKNIRGKYC